MFIVGTDHFDPARGVYVDVASELRVVAVASGAYVASFTLPHPLEDAVIGGRPLAGTYGAHTYVYQIEWMNAEDAAPRASNQMQ